jgi:alkylation response protein AidB-like acyl-CoA dehydrogenase
MGLLEFHNLTERQAKFVNLADHLAQSMKTRADAFDRIGALPLESFTELKKSAYPALTVPEAFGGSGANLLEFVMAQIHLSKGDASVALTAAMNAHVIGAAVETKAWSLELSKRIFKDVVTRGALVNAVASEPELGSPSRGGSFRTVAHKVEGGWALTGCKTWVTGGECLDFLVVHASLEGKNLLEKTGKMIVPIDAIGLKLERTWTDALSLRSSGADDAVFEEVFVPDQDFIAPSTSHPASSAWFWSAMAATYLGVGCAALDEVVHYAKTRVPTALGKPISSLQAVQQNIGRIELELKAAQSVLLEACGLVVENGASDTLLPLLAGAKQLCTNAAVTATDLSLRVAGGNALTRSLSLERHFRDARAGLVHPPSDDLTLEMIGRARLENPKI